MPQEYRTSYRAHYEEEALSVRERLEGAASNAARAKDSSILAEALKAEYAAAAGRAGLNHYQEAENFLEAAAGQQTRQAVGQAEGAVYRIRQSPDSETETERYAGYAAQQIETLEHFVLAIGKDPELRNETQAIFSKTLYDEGRIDIDFYSHSEVLSMTEHLADPIHHPPDHERTPLEDDARRIRAESLTHAQFNAPEYQNLGHVSEKEAYQESIARSTAIAAAAHVVRREIGTSPER